MSKISFLKGMGSVINLFPQSKDITLPHHSDEEAFRKDLEQVGSDMYFAINTIEQTHKALLKHYNDTHNANGTERSA